MELSKRQLEQFVDEGYLRVPGALAPVTVDRAVKAINHSLGEGIPPEEVQVYRSRSFCPEITHNPEITDLAMATPAWNLAQSLIGEQNLKPVPAGQIALRFPMLNDPNWETHPHLDGMYSKLNGVEEGTISGFSMLMGAVLGDIDSDYSGNFMVWPGTHRLHAEYFRKHGWESLLNGMPPIDLPKPVHVTAKAGDIIFAHYLLGHSAAPNLSANIRYTVYFRLYHRDHVSAESAVQPWRDFPGLIARLPNLG